MSKSHRVLVMGIDPRKVAGVDFDLTETAIALGQARFERAGIHSDVCLVGLDDTAEPQIVDYLTRATYDCVVVGGGIRKPEPLLELFELVVNLIRLHAPDAAIAFNTTAENSVDAATRWLGPT